MIKHDYYYFQAVFKQLFRINRPMQFFYYAPQVFFLQKVIGNEI